MNQADDMTPEDIAAAISDRLSLWGNEMAAVNTVPMILIGIGVAGDRHAIPALFSAADRAMTAAALRRMADMIDALGEPVAPAASGAVDSSSLG